MKIVDLLRQQKKIIVIGELGSGKSELSINLAVQLRSEIPDVITFFDLDQTKPIFRSREVRDIITNSGIVFPFEDQFMDAPTIPSGVVESLIDRNSWTILDVGGGVHGTITLGQFADVISQEDAFVIYIINPYGPFSNTSERIFQTMNALCRCSGISISNVNLVCNPFLGSASTKETIIDGFYFLSEAIAALNFSIVFTMIPEQFWDKTKDLFPGEKIRIKSYLRHIVG